MIYVGCVLVCHSRLTQCDVLSSLGFIQVGDRILEVNGESTSSMNASDLQATLVWQPPPPPPPRLPMELLFCTL